MAMMCCVQGDPGAIGFCLPIDACYVSMAACADDRMLVRGARPVCVRL